MTNRSSLNTTLKIMSKRSAPSSPVEEYHKAKKTRSEPPADASYEHFHNSAQAQPMDDIDVETGKTLNKMTPEAEATAAPGLKEASEVKETKKKAKRKAGQGFEHWTPPRAEEPIPDVQQHWGIIPRPGEPRPSEPQPSARTSNGAIVPSLWEDRKGAVRIKRGSRIINGFDQAENMYLRLMDVRPVSNKNQHPRRVAIGYYYQHGMPVDWNDTSALNDLNKALQEAIKANSNKDVPFNTTERGILADIFAKTPEISLWDAAEQFNDQAHPIVGSEEGKYPTGRFIESIKHEFSLYKVSYLDGEAPTDETEKDVPLEKAYRDWKAKQAEAKTAAKVASKKASSGKKAIKNASLASISETAGEAKKRKTKKPAVSPQATSDKTSEAAGKSKKRNYKISRSDEEMAARADATYAEIMEKEAAEKAEQAAAELQPSEQTEAPSPIVEQNSLSEEDERLSILSGQHVPRTSSPVSAQSREVFNSPSYGAKELKIGVEAGKIGNIDQLAPENAFEATEAAKAAEVAIEELVVRAEAVDESTELTSTYVQNAVRNVDLDEKYDDED